MDFQVTEEAEEGADFDVGREANERSQLQQDEEGTSSDASALQPASWQTDQYHLNPSSKTTANMLKKKMQRESCW